MAAVPGGILSGWQSCMLKTKTNVVSFRVAKPHFIRQATKDPSSASSSQGTPSPDDIKPPPAPEVTAPSESQLLAVEAKFRSKRKKRKNDLTAAESLQSDLPAREVKPWEKMTLSEKAWEVYVGEKGLLFWLNKLAYASIFVIVGGWILFRFVGPSIGLYQLDNPLLPPEKLFGGSTS